MTAQSTFSYKARDSEGNVLTGSLVAANPAEVSQRLRAEGKYVLHVSSNALQSDEIVDERQLRKNEMAKRVSREDVIAFCQQLSVMMDTGVPLAEALDAFCAQIVKKEFRFVIQAVRDDIHNGESFSTSIARWPRTFPRIMISLMKASEASGTMAMMLGRIGDYLAKERRTIKQIKGAVSYPIFMIGIAFVLTGVLMVFVLPRFATIYEAQAASLPVPTMILLGISDFILTQYVYYGPVLAVLGIVLFFWLRSPVSKRSLDWLRLNLPVISMMYRQLYVTRTARTMGTLLAAGVNLLDIIEICRGVTNNAYYDELWDDVTQKIREGKQFSDALVGCAFIPPNVVSMISSGERSSRLPDVMDRIATFSDEELDNAIKQATSYIEPIMIVTMGVLVGGVALALLLPIFNMGRVITGT
jgi:type IV pilus assembly protein PilC